MRSLRHAPLLAAAAIVAVFAAGCAGADGGSESDDATAAVLVEGSPEALAVLALVNDPTVDVKELDIAAALTSTAAKAIIAHRNGADEQVGTADDHPFATVAELDAVSGVGDATLRALLAYATKQGYLDKGGALLDVIFSPQPSVQVSHLARVAQVIAGAHDSIDVAMYSFSDAGIQKALGDAVARGVHVRFLFDTATADHRLTGAAKKSSASGKLESLGVDVRYVDKIMHHKFMIVDGPLDALAAAETATVTSGSANWSSSAATRYDENTLVFRGHPELALRLQREFDGLWDHSRDFSLDTVLPWEHASLAIDDASIPDDPNLDAFFTSSNFTVKTDVYHSTGANTIADALVAAIGNATKSIHVASGHMRSRPFAEALLQKKKDMPAIDIKVYLDDQEYISQSADGTQHDKLDACLATAGSDPKKQEDCVDNDFYYSKELVDAGIDVRFKFYAYRWDASYAKQMHDKYFVFDGATLMTGSYNLSDNAEHNTFENMLVFRGKPYADLVGAYEGNFGTIWETARAEHGLDALLHTVNTAAVIPLVFDPLSLTWSEVTTLKSALYANCSVINSDDYRSNAPAHQTCPR